MNNVIQTHLSKCFLQVTHVRQYVSSHCEVVISIVLSLIKDFSEVVRTHWNPLRPIYLFRMKHYWIFVDQLPRSSRLFKECLCGFRTWGVDWSSSTFSSVPIRLMYFQLLSVIAAYRSGHIYCPESAICGESFLLGEMVLMSSEKVIKLVGLTISENPSCRNLFLI